MFSRPASMHHAGQIGLAAAIVTSILFSGIAHSADQSPSRHLANSLGLTAFDFGTGKKLWDDDNRLTPKGRNPQATLVWLSDEARVLALNSDGELVLLRLNPHVFREESRTKIIGETWAHFAYSGNCVYARSDTEIVCVVLPRP